MPSRIGRILGAVAVLVAGVVAVQLSSRREVPVAPGSWEPTEKPEPAD